jgi:hypothetical protein
VDIPSRIFLDTNVVNFILDHGGTIFENEASPAGIHSDDLADIEALHLIFATGQRANWQMAVSPLTYDEILRTSDSVRRKHLEDWFGEVWAYWRYFFDEDGKLSDWYAAELDRKVSGTSFLAAFPDVNDRALLCHAMAYGCDAFCTRDRRTILKRRANAPSLPLQLLSPAEWGAKVAQYAGLWL